MSTTTVPMTTFNMRMSADLKKNLEDVCRQMGLSVSADPFWNEATQRRLEHSYAQLKAGKVQEHP